MTDTDAISRAVTKVRLREVITTAILSVLGSATASGLVMYVNVSNLGVKMEEHERRITLSERLEQKDSTAIAALQSREDGHDKVEANLETDLQRIDAKIDRLLERRP